MLAMHMWTHIATKVCACVCVHGYLKGYTYKICCIDGVGDFKDNGNKAVH